ncbi:MAG: ABC transporter permease [Gemmatimonadales bacterium]
MLKIWVVIRREFLERVRNKWFIISTVLGPLLLGSLMFLPAFLLTRAAGTTEVVVLDVSTDGFGERVVERLSSSPRMEPQYLAGRLVDLEAMADSLASEVGDETIDGFLILTDATIEDGTAEYRGSNVASQVDMGVIQRYVQEAALAIRLERSGIDPRVVAEASMRLRLHTVNIRGGEVTDQTGEGAFILAYFMWFLLYFALLVYGVQVAGAVVEEKSSRVIEILVSSLKPFQLLAGKIIGVGAVGLFQLTIWAGFAKVVLDRQSTILRIFGVQVQEGQQVFTLPQVSLDSLAVLLLYFVLGFFLYSTMFAAVGAMSSTESEMRQAQQPVVILFIIPAIVSFGALNDPNGSFATILTLVPLSAPVAMPMRWAVAAVPLPELALSVLILLVTALGVTWLASRIYRVGILMHGKRPTPKELIRWIRAG